MYTDSLAKLDCCPAAIPIATVLLILVACLPALDPIKFEAAPSVDPEPASFPIKTE